MIPACPLPLPFSILYKTKLPFIVVLNKTDIVDPSIAQGWMSDFELFLEALEAQEVGHVTMLNNHVMVM